MAQYMYTLLQYTQHISESGYMVDKALTHSNSTLEAVTDDYILTTDECDIMDFYMLHTESMEPVVVYRRLNTPKAPECKNETLPKQSDDLDHVCESLLSYFNVDVDVQVSGLEYALLLFVCTRTLQYYLSFLINKPS